MAVACWLLMVLAPLAAGYEQVATRGPLAARLEVWAVPESSAAGIVEVTLSGELVVTLKVEGPAPLEVAPVEAVTASSGWKVRSADAPVRSEPAPGQARWQQTFRLVPLHKDDVPLQIHALRARIGRATEWTELDWKSVSVRVTTAVMRVDLAELRPAPPPEELPPVPPWYRPWLFAGMGLAVSALLVGGWRLRHRFSRREATATPEEWALDELRRLEQMVPAEGGDAERFHTLVSDTVRFYLELRLSLPASRRTTVEFLAEMRQTPLLTPNQQALLKFFLERCDVAKFARIRLTPAECREVSTMARAFVEGFMGSSLAGDRPSTEQPTPREETP
jgi:hypothetical protein